MNEILKKLNELFKDFFDDEELVITEDTVAGDIAGWDSLEHITLMSTIEDEFDVEFDLSHKLANVGEMAKEIKKQLEGK